MSTGVGIPPNVGPHAGLSGIAHARIDAPENAEEQHEEPGDGDSREILHCGLGEQVHGRDDHEVVKQFLRGRQAGRSKRRRTKRSTSRASVWSASASSYRQGERADLPIQLAPDDPLADSRVAEEVSETERPGGRVLLVLQQLDVAQGAEAVSSVVMVHMRRLAGAGARRRVVQRRRRARPSAVHSGRGAAHWRRGCRSDHLSRLQTVCRRRSPAARRASQFPKRAIDGAGAAASPRRLGSARAWLAQRDSAISRQTAEAPVATARKRARKRVDTVVSA